MIGSTRQPFRARWRPALRLAWRDVVRAPARSLLVIALLGLPVFALSAADTLARTMQLSPAETMHRTLGDADARLTAPGAGRIEQDPTGTGYSTVDGTAELSTVDTASIRAQLPAGSRVLPEVEGRWTLQTRFGIKNTEVDDLDITERHTASLFRVVSGRSARSDGEITITPKLARAIGLSVGDRVGTVSPERSLLVVGIVAERYSANAEVARIAPGTLTALTASSARLGLVHSWYVVSPGGISWPQVLRLNRSGLVVVSRQVVLDPPPRREVPYYRLDTGGGASAQDISALGLIGGMIVLEIVLLAGPAFAVGARRSRRSLALVAAAGGTRADLRRIVLAGGLVLGAVAGAVATLAGVAVGLGLAPAVGHWTGRVPGHLDIRPLELFALVAISVVTGLIAAFMPARAAARTDVLAALRGRRDRARPRRSTPVIGILVVAAGVAVSVVGTAVWTSSYSVLAGAVLAELGLLLLTPSLLGLVGRVAPLLPVAGRMALRDTSRNRSAAAPAVAAIMAAVTGGVAIAVVVASLREHDRSTYQAGLPYGYVLLQGDTSAAHDEQVAASLATAVHARAVAVLRGLDQEATSDGTYTYATLREHGAGGLGYGGTAFSTLLVDDGSGLATIAGRSDPAAAAALRAGRAVVFDPRYAVDGRVNVVIGTSNNNGEDTTRAVSAPVYVGRSTYPLPSVVVPAGVAQQWRVPVATVGFLAATDSVPSEPEQQAATQLALQFNLGGPIVEEGYRDDYKIGLLILLAASAVMTLGAATISTALSAVDSRPDLSTLAAIGATPRVRRRLAAARAGVIAVSGTVFGVIVGMVVPVGYLLLLNRTGAGGTAQGVVRYGLTVPWLNLLVTVVVVPVLAVLGAFAFSRSRLPVERIRTG